MMVLPHGEFTIRQLDNVTFMCVLFGYEDRESYGFSAGGVYARTGFQLVSFNSTRYPIRTHSLTF